MKKVIEIVMADDHLMVREGIKKLLEQEENFIVKAMVADGVECIELVKHSGTDILLIEVRMARMNGFQVLEYLKKTNKKTKIIFLTREDNIDYVNKALDLGADGYVCKSSDIKSLRDAINKSLLGEVYIEKKFKPLLKGKTNIKNEYNKNELILTKREIQVLKLVSEGLYNKEIGFILNISEKTVKNHISNIFKKINVSDRTQAALYAIKNKYLDI